MNEQIQSKIDFNNRMIEHLQNVLEQNLLVNGLLDVSKGNERAKFVSPETVEKLLTRYETKNLRLGAYDA